MVVLRMDHEWFCFWDISRTDFVRSAQTAANRSGNPQLVHYHRKGEDCLDSCEVFQPQGGPWRG